MNEQTTKPDRRVPDDAMLKRIASLEVGHKQIITKMDENTQLTKGVVSSQVELKESQTKLQESTDELLDLFRTAKGGIKTAAWIGNFIKWSAGLLGAVIGGYLAVKAFFDATH